MTGSGTGRAPRVAIVGAGLGGLTAALALRGAGAEVTVYEQAGAFSRVGAGIQMGPNAVRVLRQLGLEAALRAMAFEPPSWRSRRFDTGEEMYDFPLAGAAEERYGAPYLQLHRGDLHELLAGALGEGAVRRARHLESFEQHDTGVHLVFADGTSAEADALVGADGVHSRVRELLFGAEDPCFTGRVAYRAVYPASRLSGYRVDPHTKWWGEDRHIVVYFLNPQMSELYFVTSVPEPDWRTESWSAKGDLGELRRAFSGFHEQVQAVLAACPSVHKWAIVQREPLPYWSEGRVTLLGDACHPMVPYMAQGAAMAMEDAAVLARCLAGAGRGALAEAFSCYEATRLARTAAVQRASFANRWMSSPTDGDWVYGYDAWQVPLEAALDRRGTTTGATAAAVRRP